MPPSVAILRYSGYRARGVCALQSSGFNKPTPLHILLADAIEMHGVYILIKLLNQFGIVSSLDTHDRFVTAIAEL